MSDQTDGELMGRYADGDAEAFDELFSRYDKRAFGYFLRRTGSEDRASDLYQDLFLRLHRFRDRYDPSRPFAPWFYRIADHVAADHFRGSMRNPETVIDTDGIPSPQVGPDRQVEQRQQALHLLSLISNEQASVLVAAKVHGLEYAEIAGRIGKSADAVKQTGARALRCLRLTAELSA